MKQTLVTRKIKIPEGVTVELKNRRIRVKGKRGTLQRSFTHVNVDMVKKGNVIVVDCWWADRKATACVRTVCSHILNLFKGVTYGFQYKMKAVYAHFPINLTIADDNKMITIRNFLGEKHSRDVPMHEGVTVQAGGKDEIVLEGNDIEKVSLSAALIHQAVQVPKKDIRKFLDGMYVSETGTVVPVEL